MTGCASGFVDICLVNSGGPWSPKFLAYPVILCFEKRCSKQNAVARLQSFWSPKISGWLRHCVATGVARGPEKPWPPKFLACLAVMCFERWCPKPNTFFKILGWLRCGQNVVRKASAPHRNGCLLFLSYKFTNIVYCGVCCNEGHSCMLAFHFCRHLRLSTSRIFLRPFLDLCASYLWRMLSIFKLFTAQKCINTFSLHASFDLWLLFEQLIPRGTVSRDFSSWRWVLYSKKMCALAVALYLLHCDVVYLHSLCKRRSRFDLGLE